jgi:hypothetical protein
MNGMTDGGCRMGQWENGKMHGVMEQFHKNQA